MQAHDKQQKKQTIEKKEKHGEKSRAKMIHVSNLEIGMYVSKLDRDWLDTPFLLQGFLIETKDDIDVLEELCEHVWIEAIFDESFHSTTNKEGGASTSEKLRFINKLPPPRGTSPSDSGLQGCKKQHTEFT